MGVDLHRRSGLSCCLSYHLAEKDPEVAGARMFHLSLQESPPMGGVPDQGKPIFDFGSIDPADLVERLDFDAPWVRLVRPEGSIVEE